jgi:hypothetical protein
MNVELKSLDPTLPLVATANGFGASACPTVPSDYWTAITTTTRSYRHTGCPMPWLRWLGRVLSLARSTSGSTSTSTPGVREPDDPAGSSFQKSNYVPVVGLDSLLVLLAQPGAGLPHWTSQHDERAGPPVVGMKCRNAGNARGGTVHVAPNGGLTPV